MSIRPVGFTLNLFCELSRDHKDLTGLSSLFCKENSLRHWRQKEPEQSIGSWHKEGWKGTLHLLITHGLIVAYYQRNQLGWYSVLFTPSHSKANRICSNILRFFLLLSFGDWTIGCEDINLFYTSNVSNLKEKEILHSYCVTQYPCFFWKWPPGV